MIDVVSTRALNFFTRLVALAALCGCSELDNCPDSKDPITIETGVSDPAVPRYESAPQNSLDAFPAKTELIFKHDLGVTPLEVKAYLAFSKDGTDLNGPGSIAESAGNQALITCKDSHVIKIKNDTCEGSFFIQVVAIGESFQDAGNSCSE